MGLHVVTRLASVDERLAVQVEGVVDFKNPIVIGGETDPRAKFLLCRVEQPRDRLAKVSERDAIGGQSSHPMSLRRHW